ncbi:hypothetical protein BLOT_016768 [Blomia tropicalis]|nr:hypothetical protein BLOT_016768 [Blomia tropicalis]
MVESKNKLNRSKLEPIRNGPYKVVEKVSPLLIKVEDGDLSFEPNRSGLSLKRGDIMIRHYNNYF